MCLARLQGLEPRTHGLEGRCSIHLSYRRIKTALIRLFSGLRLLPLRLTIRGLRLLFFFLRVVFAVKKLSAKFTQSQV